MVPVMESGQRTEQLLDRLGEGVVGFIHVRKQRVTAHARQFAHIEGRTEWRFEFTGQIVVPGFSVGMPRIRCDPDVEDFRIAAHTQRAFARMAVQLAEAPAEGLVLVAVDLLATKDQHHAFEEELIDRVELPIRQVRQIETGHLAAELGSQGRGIQHTVNGAEKDAIG